MANQVTKDRIKAIIAERKAAALRKQRAEARRAANPAVRRPLNESRRQVVRPSVIKESLVRQPKIKTLNEAFVERAEGIKDPIERNKYQILTENMFNHNKAYLEAVQAGLGFQPTAAANDAGVGLVKTYFDIFFGYFPNLIAPHIASIQPIKTPNAVVFYYQTVAGSSKGAVTKGDVLIDPFQVNTNPEYSSQKVTIAKNTAIPVWGPVVPRSVKLVGGPEITWSDDVTGTFGAAGTVAVVEAAGNITVTLGGGDAATITHITYDYDNIYAPTQVPELSANVVELPIQAKVRTLKTNFAFQAGYGFEQVYGIKLDDKLAEAAMFELKREIDLELIGLAFTSAPSIITWNRNAGLAVGTYEFHKLSFLDAVITASNHIYRKSKRVRGNVLIVGTTAQTIVETLPAFKGEDYGSQLGGPAVIGTLKNITVIATPDIPADEFLVLYKDKKDDLNAGMIFAPYLPVFATQPVMLDDFVMRRAFAESHGTLVTNPDYFVRGRIIDSPVALPMALVGKDGSDYLELGKADEGGVILPDFPGVGSI